MRLILVGVAATLDGVMGLADPYFRTAVIYFLLANEGISILENLARTGIPIPSFLKTILEQLKDKEASTK
jgi:toxin secretion/phage lysis holin